MQCIVFPNTSFLAQPNLISLLTHTNDFCNTSACLNSGFSLNIYGRCMKIFCLISLFGFQILEQYGDVSMLDIKGADATKVILVIGIMTLHSFGEGSGVGVSFAGSKGFTQGLLVTLAIAVHNIPEGLAVSMVLASRGVSPQNAMLWSVITSLPQVAYYGFLSIMLLNTLPCEGNMHLRTTWSYVTLHRKQVILRMIMAVYSAFFG